MTIPPTFAMTISAGKVPGSMREGGGNRLGWRRHALVCMPQ